jgi:hypothetical protein
MTDDNCFTAARTALSDLENALDECADFNHTDAATFEQLRDDAAALTRRFDEALQRIEDRSAQAADPHERAAARARNNHFADTGGKDWT